MKLFTCLLFAGALMECITIMVSSPLDAKSLTKPSKAMEKELSQRSKREPGVALVLSIIDKNSPKMQKLEIEMDDNGYNIKDRNSKLRSAVGKRLISELLTKGDLEIKSEVDADDTKKQKWEEMLEIIKDATECKENKRKERAHDKEEKDSFKPQKIRRKPVHKHDSDGDKLQLILDLLKNWKNKQNDDEASQTDKEGLENQPWNEELDIQSRNEESELQSEEENIKVLSSSEEVDVKLDNDDFNFEVSSAEIELNQNSDEPDEQPYRNKHTHRHRKPHHGRKENLEIEKNGRKTKPHQKERLPENNSHVNRKQKPGTKHRDEESSKKPSHREPKPQYEPRQDDSCEDGSCENSQVFDEPIKRKQKPGHIELVNEESGETSKPIKRKSKPGHIEVDNEDEETDEPVKRREKPGHIELVNGESGETNKPTKRKSKPGHIEVDNEDEETDEPVKRRQKPGHIELVNDESGETSKPMKRKSKPGHIEIDNEDEETDEPVKRRKKPGHIELVNDESGETNKPNKRKSKPKHAERDEEEIEEPTKRKLKPGHIERDNDDEDSDEPIKRKSKPGHIELDDSCENCDGSEETDESIQRKSKPEHVERNEDDESCESCEADDSIERKPKPGHKDREDKESSVSDEEVSLDKFGPKGSEPRTSSEEENRPSVDDLDEEQLLQGIAFIQNQLKRFLGIECTCNPTENTVLNECPLHKKSSERRRREDKKKSILSIRSSGVAPKEDDKKVITNKKFTKKATQKSMEKGKKLYKKPTKKNDSLAANTISKTRVYARPEKLPTTNTENILKMLKDMGISTQIVHKKAPASEVTTTKTQSPSKTTKTNDDLQFFRYKTGVRRSSTNSKSSGRKNRRKLRNRRKGNKSSTSSTYSDRPTKSKRSQRGITSEEIAAKEEEASSLHNYKTGSHKEEVILSRLLSVEDVEDPEIKSLTNLYKKYKERVQEEISQENEAQHTVTEHEHEDDVDSTDKHNLFDSTESGITESVENILKQISIDHENDFTNFSEVDDSSSEKEYVIIQDTDSNLGSLYNKFSNIFGSKDADSSAIDKTTTDVDDNIKRKFKYDEVVVKSMSEDNSKNKDKNHSDEDV